jgi:hypothetical protein
VSDKITGSDHDISFYDDMRLNRRSFANGSVRADDRMRTQLDVGSDVRRWIDNRRGMNFQSTPASLKLK